MKKLYYTFGCIVHMNELAVNDMYFKSVIAKIGKEKAEQFIKDNPLFYNSKLNRYQSFPV